ncbi:hypothetical protein [Deinococcus hopiensis]|uniref:Uncharacterized protein n=1 Tax=Deinococcus hopiensis KR-140 TaxID=695939 RepID=A0A1W1V6K4_9DEIO|nr:hypothetical protein [Deinococcus hopiensis]SMB89047.1 hypothetical protein SAMN00790413_00247 [Deinococcus hopiensis KR-140]
MEISQVAAALFDVGELVVELLARFDGCGERLRQGVEAWNMDTTFRVVAPWGARQTSSPAVPVCVENARWLAALGASIGVDRSPPA